MSIPNKLLTVAATLAVFLAATGIGPQPGEGPALLSAVLSNGRLYPAAALGMVLPVFLPQIARKAIILFLRICKTSLM